MPSHDARRAALTGAIALLLTVAPAAGQSLGEIARQEEARRKTIKTPGKVYTNEDLRPSPVPEPAPPAQPAAPAPPGAQAGSQAGTGQPAEPAQDETYWRERIQAERDALSRAETFAEALQSRINALTTDFAARDDPAQRSAIGDERQRALAELERVQQEIAQHNKNLAAIQEEARRAGVPPGWLR